MVRLSFLGLVLAVAVLCPVVVPEEAIAGAMMGETQEQGVSQKKAEADRLLGQSKQLESISEYEAALKAGEQALAIYQGIGDRNGEASALNMIGVIYRSLSPYDKAIDYSQRALAIFREVENRTGEAEALHNLAWVNHILGKYAQASKHIEQSLQIFRETRNQQGEAEALVVKAITSVQSNSAQYGNEAINNLKQALLISRFIKARRTEARSLVQLGFGSNNFPKYDDAVQYFNQALMISRQIKSREEAAAAIYGLGHVSYNTSKHKDAIQHYSQALAISKQIKNPRAEAAILSSLGLRKAELLELKEESVGDLEKSIHIFNNIKIHQSEARSLSLLGDVYLNMNDLEKAKNQYMKAAEIAKTHDFLETEFKVLSNLLSIYDEQRDARTFEFSERYIQLAKKISPESEARAKVKLAHSYGFIDFNFPKMIATLKQALQIIEDVDMGDKTSNQQDNTIVTHQNIFQALIDSFIMIGEYDNAFTDSQRRLGLIRSIKNPDRRIYHEIDGLIQLSKIQMTKQAWESAASTLEKARSITENIKKEVRKGEKSAWQSKIAIAFATLYIQKGDSDKAMEEAKRAVDLGKNINRPQLELDTLQILQQANQESNNLSEVENILKRHLVLSRKLPKSFDRVLSLSNSSEFYSRLGSYKTSREILEEAKREAKSSGIPAAEIIVQYQLAEHDLMIGEPKSALELERLVEKQLTFPMMQGAVNWLISQAYGELGNEQKAFEAAQKSLNFARKTESRQHERLILILMGDLHRKFGRQQEAISSYNEALASLDKRQNLSTNNQLVKIYAGLAKTHVALNQPTVAIAFYKQAINNVEKSRTSLRDLSPNLQKSFLQSTIDFGKVKTADIYRELAELLINQGRIGEAQAVLEALKVQEIKDFTKSVRSSTRPLEPGFSKIEVELMHKYGSLIQFSKRLNECEQNQCAQRAAITNEYNSVSRIWNERTQEIEKTATESGKQVIQAKTQDIQANTAALVKGQPNNSLVIYPFASASKVHLLWAGAGGVSYSLPPEQLCALGEAQFFSKIRIFHDLLKTPNSNLNQVKAVGKELYDCLLKPLEPQIAKDNIKHLIFIPDRATNYIPIGALFDGKQFVAERFSVSSSLSVELTDTSPSPLKNLTASSILGLGVTKAVSDFPALQNVGIELANIIKTDPNSQLGIYSGRKFLDDKFSRETLEENIQNYTVLHIATHGVFAPANPMDSYLLLGKASTFGEGSVPSFRYPIVQINALRNLGQLHLVVLSACETAVIGNDPDSGTQITGISSFFLGKNKAKAVLASLWKVDDASTSLQMHTFYTYLSQGKTKAQALQKVQQDFISGKLTPKEAGKLRASMGDDPNSPILTGIPRSAPPDYTHPFYWAPFILIGNNL